MDRERAISNSVTWCATVVSAHGLASRSRADFWIADGAVPPYYSNLITRTGDGAEAQLAAVRALADDPPKPAWSVKDSFASLDAGALERLGLRRLFDASWFGIPAHGGREAEGETGLRFSAVETPAELAHWEAAWQVSSPAPGTAVFPPGLLDDPDLTFLVALRGTDPVGGGIANRSTGAVGLSNVFCLEPDMAGGLLRDCARTVGALWPDRPIVGYGPERELDTLAPLGARSLGALRVWIAGP